MSPGCSVALASTPKPTQVSAHVTCITGSGVTFARNSSASESSGIGLRQGWVRSFGMGVLCALFNYGSMYCAPNLAIVMLLDLQQPLQR